MEPSDIRRLLDAFEHSEWNEIRLSVDGVEVFISASDAAGSLPAPSPRPAAAEASTRPAAAVTPAASAPAEAATKPAEVPDGTPVRSPSPGIFWCAPAPGAPPFVAVGDHVEAESVVCIVEVMKLMNRSTARAG